MKVRISTHAQIRIIERDIDLDKIKKVIREPDSSSAEFGGRVRVSKIVENRNITVIYTKDKNVFVIITAI